jgi:hypothetical protein
MPDVGPVFGVEPAVSGRDAQGVLFGHRLLKPLKIIPFNLA